MGSAGWRDRLPRALTLTDKDLLCRLVQGSFGSSATFNEGGTVRPERDDSILNTLQGRKQVGIPDGPKIVQAALSRRVIDRPCATSYGPYRPHLDWQKMAHLKWRPDRKPMLRSRQPADQNKGNLDTRRAWWLIGRFVAFCQKGCGFESRFSSHLGTWASPSLAVACGASAWNSDTSSALCWECL